MDPVDAMGMTASPDTRWKETDMTGRSSTDDMTTGSGPSLVETKGKASLSGSERVFLAKVVRERQRIEKEMGRLRSLAARLDDLIATYSEPSETIASTIVDDAKKLLTRRSPVASTLSMETTAKVARQILVEHGRPISRADMAKAFLKRGYAVAGTDPVRILGAKLNRAELPDGGRAFLNLTEGYWPADLKVPHGIDGKRRRRGGPRRHSVPTETHP